MRVTFAAGRAARIQLLRVRTTFVVSPLSLPGALRRGQNRAAFIGQPATPVKTVCRWVERHRSELGVSLNALRYYLDGDRTLRRLFVAAPGRTLPIRVTLSGQRLRGQVRLFGPFFGWASAPAMEAVEIADATAPVTVEFSVTAPKAEEGRISALDVSVAGADQERKAQAVLLVADAPLVREAEQADSLAGRAAPVGLPEASGATVVELAGDGSLAFDLTAPSEGRYALWLRARWAQGASSALRLALDDGKPRDLRATAMIGFTDWTDARGAHTKMFAHYGEQFAHWSWYRIPDVQLTKGEHRLTLSAGAGAALDALLLLPQNPAMDRAAMSLFHNWSFAPWENPQ